MNHTSFLLTLREAAKNCRVKTIADELRDCATSISTTVTALQSSLSLEDMRLLNGQWSRAMWLLECAKFVDDPSPTGGAMEAPKETMRMAA